MDWFGLDGEFWVALNYARFQFGGFAFAPEIGCVAGSIGEGTSIWTLAAFDGTRDTDEFCLECFAGGADHRVAVAAHVYEGKMRRQVRI